MSRFVLCAVALAPLLVGCSSLSEPAGISYAKAVTQLGINPVYPPREDMQVGDIYAVESNPRIDRIKLKSAYVAAANMTGPLETYLRSRYKFADTSIQTIPPAPPSPPPAQGADKPAPKGTETIARGQKGKRDGEKLLGPSDLTTLSIDALPQIEVDSGITIGVQGQPQGIAAVFGFAAAKTLKMSLQFGNVTSYEVPLGVADAALDSYCRDNLGFCTPDEAARLVNQKYQLGPGAKEYVRKAGLAMVAKVYLARQIVYVFDDATLAAAVAQAVGDDGKIAKPAPTVSPTTLDGILNSHDPNLIDAATALIRQLSDANAADGGNGSFSIGVANKQTVTISQIFDRPVVVGYVAAGEGSGYGADVPFNQAPPIVTK